VSHQHSLNPAETYEHYLGPTIADPWTRVLLEYAAPQPGERVLDVACGTGSVARHVAPLVGAAGQVVALDISPAMLAVARALPAPAGAPVAWLEGNAIRLDLSENAFELVLCQQGLQFFPDHARRGPARDAAGADRWRACRDQCVAGAPPPSSV
jgi:ubiquinone/menaquinone biosynthesis C-methylase UbiE